MSYRWHITGDSFIEGVGADAAGGWAHQLSEHFRARGMLDECTIAGIGGHTSRDLVARLPGEMAQETDVLLVGIGTNDSRYRPSISSNEVPPDAFVENLRQIVDIAEQKWAHTKLFVGLTRVDENMTTPFKPDKIYANAHLAEYDALIRAFAADNQDTYYLEVPRLADTPGALVDGLHPSPLGHRMLCESVVASLAEVARRADDSE